MSPDEIVPDRKTDPINRVLAGLFFAIWAALGWWSLLTNPQIIGVDFGQDPGPGLIPRIALLAITGGSLVLLGKGFGDLARGVEARWPRPGEIAVESALPLALAASLLAYVPLVRWLGFIPANFAFAIGWMAVLSRRQLANQPVQGLVSIIAGALIGVGLIWLLFIKWIGVPLR